MSDETSSAEGFASEPEPERKSRVGLWIFVGIAVLVLGGLGIGCLATILVPNIMQQLQQAFRAKANADIETLEAALHEYHLDRAGVWPAALDELVTPDADGHAYIDAGTVPLDPWGNPYRYDPPTDGHESPRVYSFGADNLPGGEGNDADIANR